MQLLGKVLDQYRQCSPKPSGIQADGKALHCAVNLPKGSQTVVVALVEDLMGRKPEKRYAFIQENAKFARDLDV